jgi:hypothetical protein
MSLVLLPEDAHLHFINSCYYYILMLKGNATIYVFLLLVRVEREESGRDSGCEGRGGSGGFVSAVAKAAT